MRRWHPGAPVTAFRVKERSPQAERWQFRMGSIGGVVGREGKAAAVMVPKSYTVVAAFKPVTKWMTSVRKSTDKRD